MGFRKIHNKNNVTCIHYNYNITVVRSKKKKALTLFWFAPCLPSPPPTPSF